MIQIKFSQEFFFFIFKVILRIRRGIIEQSAVEMSDVFETGDRGPVKSYRHNLFMKCHRLE